MGESVGVAKNLKVIEILSETPNNWEEATQNVVIEASETLRNIRSTAPLLKRFAVARRGINRFDPGIDSLEANLSVLGPIGNKPPAQSIKRSLESS